MVCSCTTLRLALRPWAARPGPAAAPAPTTLLLLPPSSGSTPKPAFKGRGKNATRQNEHIRSSAR